MDEAMTDARYDALPVCLVPGLTVVTGHYGVGKTNISINLALDAAALDFPVTLVDLDVVNPYFRSSDYSSMLESKGVEVIAPVFAGSTLDTPSISGKIYTVLDELAREQRAGSPISRIVIIDAGGDDVGATVLGRFAQHIRAIDYRMLYVVNFYRNLTQKPQEAAVLLSEIENSSHLRASGIINNSHLQEETTIATIEESLSFATTVASLSGLPLVCTTVPKTIGAGDGESVQIQGRLPEPLYSISRLVLPPWNL